MPAASSALAAAPAAGGRARRRSMRASAPADATDSAAAASAQAHAPRLRAARSIVMEGLLGWTECTRSAGAEGEDHALAGLAGEAEEQRAVTGRRAVAGHDAQGARQQRPVHL